MSFKLRLVGGRGTGYADFFQWGEMILGKANRQKEGFEVEARLII